MPTACFIALYNYTTCIGPTPETITDFWQMIWDVRPAVIVMLTKVHENGKVRACMQRGVHTYRNLLTTLLILYSTLFTVFYQFKYIRIHWNFVVISHHLLNLSTLEFHSFQLHIQMIPGLVITVAFREKVAYCFNVVSISLQRKCEQYWNDDLNKPFNAGRVFTVFTTGYRGFADYVVRDMTVMNVSHMYTNVLLDSLQKSLTFEPLFTFLYIGFCWTPLCEAISVYWMARSWSPSTPVIHSQVHPAGQEGGQMCRCTHCGPLQVRGSLIDGFLLLEGYKRKYSAAKAWSIDVSGL